VGLRDGSPVIQRCLILETLPTVLVFSSVLVLHKDLGRSTGGPGVPRAVRTGLENAVSEYLTMEKERE
jgi:hypothetical protein